MILCAHDNVIAPNEVITLIVATIEHYYSCLFAVDTKL
jgi:hypothetical protein